MRDDTIPHSIMNDVLRKIEDQQDQQGPPFDHSYANVVEEAMRQVNYHDDQIRQGAERIARITVEVLGSVAMGRNLNELGEYQRNAQEVDRHIALRHAAYQVLGLALGREASKLATGRFVSHLRDEHGQTLMLPEGDMNALNALHQVVVNQNEELPSCAKFRTS